MHLASTQARSFSLTLKAAAGTGFADQIASRHRVFHRLFGAGIGERDQAVAGLRHEGVEIDDRGHRRADLLGGLGDHETRGRMADQHDILKVFPFHQIDHVADMGRQVDVLAQQMRAIADAGQGSA